MTTLLTYEGPVCLRCAHRHPVDGPCASHEWGDECAYQAGADCPTTTRPPLPVAVRHWCGKGEGHDPHIGCNGFGFFAGPVAGCERTRKHEPHRSCDGLGRP